MLEVSGARYEGWEGGAHQGRRRRGSGVCGTWTTGDGRRPIKGEARRQLSGHFGKAQITYSPDHRPTSLNL